MKPAFTIKKSPLIVCIVLLITGCKKNGNEFNGYLIDDFPEPIELKGTTILEQELNILYVSFADTLLMSIANRDTLFHLYDKTLNHVSSFGLKGRGPGEFVMPPIIQDVILKQNSTIGLIYDQFRKELIQVNLTSSIERNELVIDDIIEVPRDLWGVKKVFSHSQDEFIGVYDDRDEQRLDGQKGGFYYYTKNDSIKIFEMYNLKVEPYETLAEMNVNATVQSISPNRNKMAVAKVAFPGLEIFEIGRETPTRFLFDNTSPVTRFDLEDYHTNNFIEYFTHIYTTDNNIYLLYSGSKRNEPGTNQKIKVLDWNGNPKAQYLISPEYDLGWFVVDEGGGKIYGSSYRNDAVYLISKPEFDK